MNTENRIGKMRWELPSVLQQRWLHVSSNSNEFTETTVEAAGGNIPLSLQSSQEKEIQNEYRKKNLENLDAIEKITLPIRLEFSNLLLETTANADSVINKLRITAK